MIRLDGSTGPRQDVDRGGSRRCDEAGRARRSSGSLGGLQSRLSGPGAGAHRFRAGAPCSMAGLSHEPPPLRRPRAPRNGVIPSVGALARRLGGTGSPIGTEAQRMPWRTSLARSGRMAQQTARHGRAGKPPSSGRPRQSGGQRGPAARHVAALIDPLHSPSSRPLFCSFPSFPRHSASSLASHCPACGGPALEGSALRSVNYGFPGFAPL